MEIRCPFCRAAIPVERSEQYACPACRAIFRVDFEAARAGTPWERRADLGLWAAFWRTTAGVLFRPVALFGSMRKRDAEIGAPLAFLILWLILRAIAHGVFSVPEMYATPPRIPAELLRLLPPEARERVQEALMEAEASEVPRNSAYFAIGAACSPVVEAIAIFIASVAAHLGLLVTGGARNGYDATLRVFCYSAALNALLLAGLALFLPAVAAGGGFHAPAALALSRGVQAFAHLLSFGWGLSVLVIGLREAHETTTGQALGALLGFVLLLFCCCALPLLLLFSTPG